MGPGPAEEGWSALERGGAGRGWAGLSSERRIVAAPLRSAPLPRPCSVRCSLELRPAHAARATHLDHPTPARFSAEQNGLCRSGSVRL